MAGRHPLREGADKGTFSKIPNSNLYILKWLRRGERTSRDGGEEGCFDFLEEINNLRAVTLSELKRPAFQKKKKKKER